MGNRPTIAGFLQCNVGKLEEAEDFKLLSVPATLVIELLSNDLPFVGQLYADKSLARCARDLNFFTTDLQT